MYHSDYSLWHCWFITNAFKNLSPRTSSCSSSVCNAIYDLLLILSNFIFSNNKIIFRFCNQNSCIYIEQNCLWLSLFSILFCYRSKAIVSNVISYTLFLVYPNFGVISIYFLLRLVFFAFTIDFTENIKYTLGRSSIKSIINSKSI